MPIDTVLSLVDHVRTNGHDRYMARCRAHDDRGPSLSIRSTSDGTVLVRCFAGCDAASIVAALGLELRDLFPSRSDIRPDFQRNSRRRAPTSRRDVEQLVQAEVAAIVAREKDEAGVDVAVLTRHVAHARIRVAQRLGDAMPAEAMVALKAAPVRWFEIEPHCTDPAWRSCVQRAIEELAFRCHVPPALVRDHAAANVGVADRVLRDAREVQRGLAAAR
jgi:hypothetical protein